MGFIARFYCQYQNTKRKILLCCQWIIHTLLPCDIYYWRWLAVGNTLKHLSYKNGQLKKVSSGKPHVSFCILTYHFCTFLKCLYNLLSQENLREQTKLPSTIDIAWKYVATILVFISTEERLTAQVAAESSVLGIFLVCHFTSSNSNCFSKREANIW